MRACRRSPAHDDNAALEAFWERVLDFLPDVLAFLAGFLLWGLLTLVPLPTGPVNAIAVALLAGLSEVAMVVGAAIGGTIAQNRPHRLNRA